MLKKSAILKIGSLVVVVGLLAAVVLIWFNKPLGTALALSIPEKAVAAEKVSADRKSVKFDSVKLATNCNETGAIVFLFTSYDSSKWSQPHGADMIRYFRADFSNLTIDEVTLPRDLWVNTPVLAPQNITNKKLGKVFEYEPYAKLIDQKDVIIKSTSNLAQTVFDNFAVSPTNYITLDAVTFASMVDTLGGIDVVNKYTFNTENYSFVQGNVHLDGAKASEYVRWFNDDLLEVKRFNRQESVLIAIWQKMILPENITKFPNLIKQFQENFVTDFTPAQITNLFCLVQKVTLEKMKTHNVSSDMFTTGGPDNSFIPDVEKIKTLLNTVLFPAQ
jgi:LCP family protein required for cell wall assembly